MLMRIKKYILAAAVATCVGAHAQYDPAYTHYWMMEPSFNAATVGKDDKLNITAAYSMQMTGFRHAPKTMYAAADMPLIIFRKRHGIACCSRTTRLASFHTSASPHNMPSTGKNSLADGSVSACRPTC